VVNVQIKGAEQLGDLAKRLKAEGESGKGMRTQMLRELRAAAKPLAEDAKRAVEALPTKPPQDRGLRAGIAKGVKVRTRTSGRQVGTRITVARFEGTNLPRKLNKGTWRHPVFGTDTYVTQTIKPGWFDRTMRRGAPAVRRRAQRVLSDTAKRITRG
jgi:hypothetical protein